MLILSGNRLSVNALPAFPDIDLEPNDHAGRLDPFLRDVTTCELSSRPDTAGDPSAYLYDWACLAGPAPCTLGADGAATGVTLA